MKRLPKETGRCVGIEAVSMMQAAVVALLANAAVFVVILVLVSLQADVELKDWVFQAVPSYMQGFGTIGAAWLAYIAFREWNAQERTKQNAAEAAKLLVAVHQAYRAVKVSRRPGWPIKFPVTIEQLRTISEGQDKRCARADEAVTLVEGLLIVGKVSLGEEMEKAASKILAAQTLMRGATNNLRRLTAPNNALMNWGELMEPDSDQWRKETRQHLETVGYREGSITENVRDWRNEKIEKLLEDGISETRQLLEPHIQFASR